VGALEVDTGTLNVRQGPSTNDTIISTVTQGEVYATFETNGSWKRISYNQQDGWIHGGYTKASGAQVKAVTASTLNVRSGPGTQYAVLGTTRQGRVHAVLAASGTWSQIRFGGAEAWVSASYLADPTAAPPTTTITTTTTTTTGTTSGSSSGTTGAVSTRGFIQFEAAGSGFYCYSVASRRWGRSDFVYGTLRIARERIAANPSWPRVGIGEISLENGGPISGHASHQKGVDGDFRLCRSDAAETALVYQNAAYSRARTQDLVNRFRAVMPVTHIFFNDPAVTGVSDWPNHDNHLHVRIRE